MIFTNKRRLGKKKSLQTIEIGVLGTPDTNYFDDDLMDEEVKTALYNVVGKSSSNTQKYGEIYSWESSVVTNYPIFFDINTSLIPSNISFSTIIKLRLCSRRDFVSLEEAPISLFGITIQQGTSHPNNDLMEEKIITNTSLYEEEINFSYNQINSINDFEDLSIWLRVGYYGGYLSGGSVFITYEE